MEVVEIKKDSGKTSQQNKHLVMLVAIQILAHIVTLHLNDACINVNIQTKIEKRFICTKKQTHACALVTSFLSYHPRQTTILNTNRDEMSWNWSPMSINMPVHV